MELFIGTTVILLWQFKKDSNKLSERSKQYNLDGTFSYIEDKYQDKSIFRKISKSKAELEIIKILINKSNNKNIATYYRIIIHNSPIAYIDAELLLDINLTKLTNQEIKQIMSNVKTYLQSLGIIYIDWKPDNIGIGMNGELKLFDFDCSGLIDINTGKWIIKPVKFHSYRKAISLGAKTPIEIDNCAFDFGFNDEE